MKKNKKLAIKKVTLKNLDEPILNNLAGAGTGGGITCFITCITCAGQLTCHGGKTCVTC